MLDPITHGKMVVNTDGNTGPYIMVVPGLHRQRVESALRSAGVTFGGQLDVGSSGDDYFDLLNLGKGTDVDKVQMVLDAIPDLEETPLPETIPPS